MLIAAIDPHRGKRVPAEVEEGVVDADAIEAEHLGVDAREDVLDGDRWGRGNGQRRGIRVLVGRGVSSLPLTVIGSACNTTTAAGTM